MEEKSATMPRCKGGGENGREAAAKVKEAPREGGNRTVNSGRTGGEMRDGAYDPVVALDELDGPDDIEQLHHPRWLFRGASLRRTEEVVEAIGRSCISL